MFEWNWVSLKSECTNVLGPEGIDWILVSPPQESIQGSQWWVNYQPISYKIQNSLGSRVQFTDMVNACNAAGVEVIVDAVINHMSAGNYSYPDVPYGPSDFHATLPASDRNYCDSSINWNDLKSIQHCELLGLNDLATEKQSVRDKIDGYLNDLISIGVSGFRVDAAYHIPVVELRQIQDGLNLTTGGIKPFFVQEVAVHDNTTNAPYAVQGQVFGWNWQDDMVAYFGGGGDLTGAQWVNGTYSSLNGTDKTVTMVSNHDTERDGSALTYQDGVGKKFLQASIYTLVNQYGLPMLYTGYAFSNRDAGPDQQAGYVKNVSCGGGSQPASNYADGQYVCLDRWTAIKGAIAWKDAVGTAQASTVHGHLGSWSDKYSTYSFKRGAGSFIVFNGSSLPVKNAKIATGLPKGTYCDYISGGTKPLKAKKTCAGSKVVVDAKGYGVISIPWSGTVALTTKIKF
jgi:alpha-amylase